MDRVERAIRDLPEVSAVGLTGGLPLGGVDFRQPYGAEGTLPEDWSRDEANFRVITAEFFEAMGTRVLAGRAFTPVENVQENERVAVVSAGLAARLAPGGDAVGRIVGFPLDGSPVFATIVGVVEDVRLDDLRRPGGETIYVPYRQEASRTVNVAVRTRGPSTGLPQRIRAIVRTIASDVSIPVYDFRDMRVYVDRALGPTRFALALIAGFAGLALVLAVVGLAGVMSYIVSRRTREFGIRIAVGADPATLLRHVLRTGVGMAAIGLLAGFGIALATSSALNALVFEVARVDPVTYALSSLTLFAAAILASWWPARRAAAVEPLTALRVD